jgi:hypothetical protein
MANSATDPTRKTAFVAGVLYLVTYASSIPAALLLGPALTNPDYITGAGSEGPVRLAALLDLVNALAAIGTAVALYSVMRRQHEGFALGFLSSRAFEAAVLTVGVLAMLSMVTLRSSAQADAPAMVAIGQTLVAVRDWSFGIGTGMAALNAVFLGTLLYRSGLVPRPIPALGLIGAVTFGSFVVGYILGVTEPGTIWHAVGVAPIFIWELVLGLWMTFKGFQSSAVEGLGFATPADAGSSVPAAVASKAGAA